MTARGGGRLGIKVYAPPFSAAIGMPAPTPWLAISGGVHHRYGLHAHLN